jgi:hypothetical protein
MCLLPVYIAADKSITMMTIKGLGNKKERRDVFMDVFFRVINYQSDMQQK